MREHDTPREAVLYAAKPPNPTQERRLLAFLHKKYGEEISLRFEVHDELTGGLKLVVGSEVYDWTDKGRLHEFEDRLHELAAGEGDIIPLLRETVHKWTPHAIAHEEGRVLTSGDGIAFVSGLENATYGEILLFEGGVRGMVQELDKEALGCILFDDEEMVGEGGRVLRTGRTAGVPVGEAFLGRVINPLGLPIDDGGEIEAQSYRPIEHAAPTIIERQPVDTPLETGLLAIDAMFPIGRGQRELIIGDRQTGKTAIAVDAILNQRGKDVICVYVAIGQKASSVAQLVANLARRGGMDYTVVIAATAGDAAPLQYVAPYAGCAMAEYFMEQGRDVLIIYDDLSKHATAYRSLSLLLERPPGREAYPGDVFYLHARLLERAAHLSDERGGGSMTALPIVETQAGDVSAYIPTNIISITDGQIFLESRLFNSGQRPAVNVGLSVSRVGGDAQTSAMKQAVGTLRLDLSQFREMEVFTQFSSDLDEATRSQLVYGQGLMAMLRQEQYRPYRQHEQVIILLVMLSKLLQDVPTDEIRSTLLELISRFQSEHGSLCARIDESGELSAEDKAMILDKVKAWRQQSK